MDFFLDTYEALQSLSSLFYAIIGGLIVSVFGPNLNQYVNKKYFKSRAYSKRAAKRIFVLFSQNRSSSKFPAEYVSLIRIWLFKRVIVNAFQVVVVVGIFIGIFTMHSIANEYLRESRASMLSTIDENNSQMYFRTVRNLDESNCPRSTEPELAVALECLNVLQEEASILRQQHMCNLQANLESAAVPSNIEKTSVAKLGYEACMLEGGWYIVSCNENELNCVRVSFTESICTSLMRHWLRSGGSDHVIRFCDDIFPW